MINCGPRWAKKYNTAHQGPQFIIGLHYFYHRVTQFYHWLCHFSSRLQIPQVPIWKREWEIHELKKEKKTKKVNSLPNFRHFHFFFWGGGYVRFIFSYWCVSHFSIVLFSIIPEADPRIRIRIKMIRIRNNEFFYNLQFPN